MRRQHLTRRQLLRLAGGGLAVGALGGTGQAAPVAHDGESLGGSNLVAGLEAPEEEDSGELRLLVAWEEQFNGRVVDAYPADRTGKQAPLWSRAQYQNRLPMVSARTLESAFRQQFLDIDALYGASGNQPLMDLTGIRPGDEGQLDLFVQPVGRDGIVGVTGRLISEGPQQPQTTAGSDPAGGTPAGTTPAAATTPLADAVAATLVQTGHTGVGEMTTVVLAEGTLREVLATVGSRPLPLDGDLSTPTLDCTTDTAVPHVRLTWRLPETAPVAADDGAQFDLRFTAVPCPAAARPALSVSTRSYKMSSNRLVYIVRVRNDGPTTARNVRVVPKREVGPTNQRTTLAGYGNCLLDPYDWLDIGAIRVRKGPTTSMLSDFSKGDAGGGLTYDQTYDPRTGIWHLGTVEPKQTWELLVTLNTGPCAAGETFRNTVEVRTDNWWDNRLHDPAMWTATTETALN